MKSGSRRWHCFALTTLIALIGFASSPLPAAQAKRKAKVDVNNPRSLKDVNFQWVAQFPSARFPQLKHATFFSQTNQCEPVNAKKRYPVVYYLHGGRPGGELKSAGMAKFYDEAMRSGKAPPMIYVFVNGGRVSHYDYPTLKSYGETVFVKELIPHIDATYRTIATRAGRGIEGFSQGGRGTGRIMFKFPELFCSAAPMGGGHQHEKYVSEHNGREEGGLDFGPGNNTYDLARSYVKRMKEYPLHILVAVGTKGFNYEANLDWMKHLESLKIPFRKIIVEGAHHSAMEVYATAGIEAMRFHARNFGLIK